MKNEVKTLSFDNVSLGESFSIFDKDKQFRSIYTKTNARTAIQHLRGGIKEIKHFKEDEKVDVLVNIPELTDNEKLNKSIEEYKDILKQSINKGKIIADIKDKYHGCLSEKQIAPFELINYLEKFEPVVISKMENAENDIISRKEVIDGINELLESPFAHSQYGIANEECAYKIRKEMAEVIINLCVKERRR
jgi:hypothetical protein